MQAAAKKSVRRHMWRELRRSALLLCADIAVVLVLRAIKSGIRDHAWLGSHAARGAADIVPRGTVPLPQLVAAVLISTALLQNYGTGDDRRDIRRLTLASFLAIGLVVWERVWEQPSFAMLIGSGLAAVGLSLGLIAERLVVDGLIRKARAEASTLARTLVVGPGEIARSIVNQRMFQRSAGFDLLGFIDTGSIAAPDAIGSFDDLCKFIDELRADTIILAGQFDEDCLGYAVTMASSAGCKIFSLPRLFLGDLVVPELVSFRGKTLIQLTKPGLRGQQLALKRAIDVIGASLLMAVSAPALAIIAIAVRLSSSGPIIFRQQRVGQGGRLFRICKFRSMVVTAETDRENLAKQSVYSDARLFKLKHDPRVTTVGAWLRKTSLDELPQLWNVVRGHMSLVGPRPPLPSEVALYEEHHYARFEMKPGITGPWQVNGRNRITSFDDVILLEQDYMRSWTIWKDIRILLRTIPVVLRMEGAY